MAEPRERTPPPRRTPAPGRESPENPFLSHQSSLPAWRVRLPLQVHQRRILLLFVIALILAVIVALLGTRLLSRPRQVRSSVTADVRVLDARVSEVVTCLGGPGMRVDEGKLTRRILERALAEEGWPQVTTECRAAAMLLHASASAIAASAQAAQGKVPQPIQRRYRQALAASERLLAAVGLLVEDVHRGQRLPSLPHAEGVTRALADVQTALGTLERLAGSSSPRTGAQVSAEKRPPWPEAARLAADLHHGPTASLVPFGESEGRRALRLVDPGTDGPVRLLLRPLDEAQWLSLPRQVAPEPARKGAAPESTARPASTGPRPKDPSLGWLGLDLPEGHPPAPSVLYARSSWDNRAARGLLHLGHFPSSVPEIALSWTHTPGVAARAWAGLARGAERLVLVGAPRGPSLVIALLRSKDGGKTYDRPLVLADDADPQVRPQWAVTDGAEPILVYAPLGGGIALQALQAPKGPQAPQASLAPQAPQASQAPQAPQASQAPVEGMGYPVPRAPHGDQAPRATPTAAGVTPRTLLPSGQGRPILGLCRAAAGRIYLLDGYGRPWVGALPGGPFVPMRPGAPGSTLPGLGTRGNVRLACYEGRAALAWSEGQGIYHYTTCDGETCGRPERVSPSRLEDVLLAATRRSVLVLARDAQVIFQRRDPGGTGLLASARPVAHLARPVAAWSLVPGHDAQRLALLLLDGGLGRLRTADGGRRWAGE